MLSLVEGFGVVNKLGLLNMVWNSPICRVWTC